MKMFRIISSLLIVMLVCIILPLGVLAEDEATTTTTTTTPPAETTTTTPPPTTETTTTTTPPPEISLTMKTTYPKIEVVSGSQVQFQVSLIYKNTYEGASPEEFDLVAIVPNNWTGYVNSSSGTRIASINLDPTLTYGTTVNVYASPSSYLPPEPGEYKITLQASSAEVKSSIDLVVVITAQYSLSIFPSGSTPVYSTSSTAGKEKIYSITIQNTGSATIDNITLSSSAPKDWVVQFPQDSINEMIADSQQTMDVKITPAKKAIAGDYMITLMASGKQSTAQNLQVRVTVATPSIWGIVGIVIIVIVIVGLAYVFMRFSRR